MKKKQKVSKKWTLVLMVFWASTLLVFAPPFISVWLMGLKAPLVIISGVEYVSLITLCAGAYFSANVFQRSVELKNGYNSETYGDAQYNNTGFADNTGLADSNANLDDLGKEA